MDDAKTMLEVLLHNKPAALDVLMSDNIKIKRSIENKDAKLLTTLLCEYMGKQRRPPNYPPSTKWEPSTGESQATLMKETLAATVLVCWARALEIKSLPPLPVE